MSQPDPLAALRSRHRSLEREAEKLLESAAFTDELEAITDRVAGLAELQAELQRLDARAWIWTGELSARIAPLPEAGRAAQAQIQAETAQAKAELYPRAVALVSQVQATPPAAGMEPAFAQLEGQIEKLEDRVQSLAKRIDAISEPFVKAYDQVKAGVRQGHKHMDRFDEAQLPLLPEENPYTTVKATWEDAPGEKTEGMLFLTDLRLRFQGVKEVATKKFLFITTESKTVRELMLDVPIGHLASSEDSKRGMIIKDQLITLGWKREAQVRGDQTTFEVHEGSAKSWDSTIEEIASGAVRRLVRCAEPATGASAGEPVEWATNCSACAAPMPTPVKGQTSTQCPYCGQNHPVVVA